MVNVNVGAGGGKSYANLSRIPLDGDVQGLWDFDWDSGSESTILTDRSGNGNTLVPDGGNIGPTYTKIGNLSGAHFFTDDALRVADSTLEITGDLTIEALTTWDGTGTTAAALLGYYGVGETEATNTLYLLANHGTTGAGLRYFTESGAGVNEEVNTNRVEPTRGGIILLGMIVDTTANTVTWVIDGIEIVSLSYTNDPSGGTSAELVVGEPDVSRDHENMGLAGLCISDIARSIPNMLARAVAVGVA